MEYLVDKKQGGKTYYHLTESAHIEGKPPDRLSTLSRWCRGSR